MTKKISEIQFPISNKDGFVSKMNKQKMKALPALCGDFLLMNLAWIATKEGPTKPFG
jgi:hypothetical protein